MSTDRIKLTINDKARSYAKIYSSLIQDEYQRKRANAAITALFSYVNFLQSKSNVNIQNSMTLYRNPSLCEQFELADFYMNNYHIDVRVTTNPDIVIIPKTHYDNSIIPDFYVVIYVDTELKNAELAGIVDTVATQPEPFDGNYYKVDSDFFISQEDFIVRTQREKLCNSDFKEHEFFKDNYLGFIDNEINQQKRSEILKHLFQCPDCRTEFCCFTGFEMVNCNVSKYPELLEDKTLHIIGAQAANEEKYKGKEEVIYIKDEENKQKNPNYASFEDFTDETTMDVVPDLFPTQAPEHINITKTDSDDIINELFGLDDDDTFVNVNTENVNSTQNIAENNSAKIEYIDDSDTKSILDEVFNPTDETVSSSEIPSDVDDTVQDDVKRQDIVQNEISNIFDEEEYPEGFVEEETKNEQETAENKNQEETANEVNATEVNESNVLDQVFFDGALEREAQEQQAVSYVSLSTPVDSYIPEPQNSEPESPIQQTVNETENNSENGINEDTSESNEDSDNIIETDDTNFSEDISENEPVDDNNENSEINEEQNNELSEEVQSNYIQEEQEGEIVSEDNEQEVNNGETLKEEIIDEKSDNGDVVNSQIDTEYTIVEERNNDEDELLSALPEETNSEKIYKEDIDAVFDNDENYGDDDDYDEEDEEDAEEDDEYEDGMNNDNYKDSSLKNIIITVCIITALLLASGAGIYFFLKNKNSSSPDSSIVSAPNTIDEVVNEGTNDIFEIPIDENTTEIPLGENFDNENSGNDSIQSIDLNSGAASDNIVENSTPNETSASDVKQLTEKDLVEPVSSNGDINKAITKALSAGENLITLRGINWFCASELFSDRAFKNYMQNIDNTLKQNLKSNIMGVTEIPPKNEITVKLAVDNQRNLRKAVISESSDSEEVDKIVLRSINETFEGEKSPILTDSPLKADMYYFKVVIKL